MREILRRQLSRVDPFLSFGTFEEAVPTCEHPPGIERWYRRVFHVGEIDASPPLQAVFWALLLGYYVTFNKWISSPALTVKSAQRQAQNCWPYYPDCQDWHVLQSLPDGYSQNLLYMVLFGFLMCAAVSAARRNWTAAHAWMLPCFVWKLLVIWVFTQSHTGNYHTFHMIYCAIFLFASHKLYFLRRSTVWLYLLAGTIKIEDGWLNGTYFTNLVTGLPFVPDALVPLCSHGVVVLEVVVASMLLSRHYLTQRLALLSFVAFHLYSGLLVNYMYPTMCLGPLLCIFGVSIRPARTPVQPKAAFGWALLATFTVMHSWSFFLQGDTRHTLEANKYGLYMFEANHQCISELTLQLADGTEKRRRDESPSARRRCDPYRVLQHAQNGICKSAGSAQHQRIRWTFDHSINGGPFYRIVDEDDVCRLRYDPFRHNPWIRGPEDGARAVGRPVKNIYR